MCRISRCLCVLTVCVCVLLTVRRIELLARDESTVFSTLSKGSICFAIVRAAVGEAPFGMKLWGASPERCDVAAVAANTECICPFLDGWNLMRRLRSQFSVALSDDSSGCAGNRRVDGETVCKSSAETRGGSPFLLVVFVRGKCPCLRLLSKGGFSPF